MSTINQNGRHPLRLHASYSDGIVVLSLSTDATTNLYTLTPCSAKKLAEQLILAAEKRNSS